MVTSVLGLCSRLSAGPDLCQSVGFLCRVVYKFLSSWSFVKSRRLWESGDMLPWKIFENWNAGKRISWHFGP